MHHAPQGTRSTHVGFFNDRRRALFPLGNLQAECGERSAVGVYACSLLRNGGFQLCHASRQNMPTQAAAPLTTRGVHHVQTSTWRP